MTKFPLCEELGLTIETRYILAADLERLLRRAPVVYGHKSGDLGNMAWVDYEKEQLHWTPTHTALLLNVKPIKKDTAKSLLRDYLVEYEKFKRGEGDSISVEPWVKRVRKLLEVK